MPALNDLMQRVVRYADLRPCTNAFVDTRSPGSDRKENFTIVGPGVSENPNQYVHIPEPHGFNIGAARQPPKCLNSQHSHETAEVFIVHTGNWRFMWGVDAKDGEVFLNPGDTISIPTRMFRGFENVGSDTGFLFAVLGGDDPGKVTWAPQVFDLAKRYGLVLLKGGRLVDTTLGETVPPGAEPEAPPDAATLAALATPANDRLMAGVVAAAALHGNPASPLAAPGVEECAIIVPRATEDGFPPGPITGWWPHGFTLRALRMDSGATVRIHSRAEAEVILMHAGVLEVSTPSGPILLGPGDTFSVPAGLPRGFRASSSAQAVAYVVRGTEQAAAPRFQDAA
jgi:quercetin dioxygenase-like cupin family protein